MRKAKVQQAAAGSGPGSPHGQGAQQLLAACRDVVTAVSALEPQMQARTDAGLRELTGTLRTRLAGGADLDALLPEAFAAAREAAVRTLGQRPFDVQVMCGAVLHWGHVAEMRTGEGKTLAATMPAYLGALAGAGLHVMTANDYLAGRDAAWMRPLYRLLGLQTGLIADDAGPDPEPAGRRAAYNCDITYGGYEQFGYDFLRDNMAWASDDRVQRGLEQVIIDEADQVLIDEARTALSFWGPPDKAAPAQQPWLTEIAARLQRGRHYDVSEHDKQVRLTDEGALDVEDWLGIASLYDTVNLPLVRQLENALAARECYLLDRDYIVRNGQIVIIDAVSGRPQAGHVYSDGVQAAIQAKEGLSVQDERQVLATVRLHDYLKRYGRVAAMTGTASSDAEIYRQVYQLDVVTIPTNSPMIRVDHPDVLYRTMAGKLAAIADEVATRHAAGQPVLVGTASIEQSGRLSGLLAERGVGHEVLTARNYEQEARLIAEAGQLGAVTVIARMAGRGTDIVLGGTSGAGREEVAERGGLCVLGTERFSWRRLDDHLRGRAGRQGDPGESKFLVSFEDDVAGKLFASKVTDRLGRITGDGYSYARLSRAIDDAQARRAASTAAWLAENIEYDVVQAEQQRIVYAERRAILQDADVQARFRLVLHRAIRAEIDMAEAQRSDAGQIRRSLRALYPAQLTAEILSRDLALAPGPRYAAIIARVTADAEQAYSRRETELGTELLSELARMAMLKKTDLAWHEHLAAMAALREGIGLRALGGRSPLAEYRREAARMFTALCAAIDKTVVGTVFFIKTEDPKAARRLAGLDASGGEDASGTFEAGGPRQ